MSLAQSFPPIAGKQAKILILGSIPGEASLAAQQYYAHPRNAFWPIMARWLQIPLEASYQEQIMALQASPIALWDVLKSCRRSGSLDSNIEADTQIINDFHTFFSIHREITQVLFNGGKTCFVCLPQVQPMPACPSKKNAIFGTRRLMLLFLKCNLYRQ